MSTESTDKLQALQAELAQLKAEHHEFIYAVTHDLIGSFRQIEGFSNIILKNHTDQFDSNLVHHFDMILTGTKKGKESLQALQVYSKTATADYIEVPISSDELIAEVQSALANIIKNCNAKISCNNTPDIIGDHAQLYSLFYHLIHNALHYQSADASPEIVITAIELDQHWQFSIQDNGIGFREKMADRLFTALKRGVTNKNYSGLGIGLTVARSVVQRHSGRIWATSVLDEGSTFNFTIKKGSSNE